MIRISNTISVTLSTPKLSVTLHEPKPIEAEILGVVIYSGSGERYYGEYEVTPKTSAQTLYTTEKLLSDDITVHSIPIKSEQNVKGGLTVTIGG